MSAPEQQPVDRVLVWAIVAAQFGPPFMFSGVAVALPEMGHELHMSATELGLVETAFIATATAFVLPAGRFADVADRRSLCKWGLLAFGLIPILTAAENVEVPLRLRRAEPEARDARVHELLHLVDLGDRAHHRPPELSGGEQQRVAIARALGNEPRLLVADEPTGQLDSHRVQMVMTLLRRLVHERDVLAIVATHDPLMMELADHLVELRDGEVVGEEEATHVSAAPHAG